MVKSCGVVSGIAVRTVGQAVVAGKALLKVIVGNCYKNIGKHEREDRIKDRRPEG